MPRPLRSVRFILPLFVWEKKQLDRLAKESGLNTTDYVREKLGLQKARTKRNQREEELENPEGDPGNAVDVEELAKEIFNAQQSPRVGYPLTMAESRREAKRRLAKTP